MFFHYGGHGIHEAIWYAVPLVGIPIFTDSEDRMAYAQKHGIGVGVPKGCTMKQLRDAIVEVISNKK